MRYKETVSVSEWLATIHQLLVESGLPQDDDRLLAMWHAAQEMDRGGRAVEACGIKALFTASVKQGRWLFLPEDPMNSLPFSALGDDGVEYHSERERQESIRRRQENRNARVAKAVQWMECGLVDEIGMKGLICSKEEYTDVLRQYYM